MTSHEGARVLVVDDEEDVLRFLSAILEDAGFTVDTASNGEKALELVKQVPPDLISLDLVMPGKSGTRFLYTLRKNREWSRIPVLVVTGHAHDDLGKGDLAEILSGKVISGPAVYLEKPVTPMSYVSAVKRQLGLPEDDVPSAARAAGPDVKSEVEKELAEADPETMREILRLLRKGKETSGDTGARVLVIDDEPDVASYLAALLADAGYSAETATGVEDGLARAVSDPPDLITLDVDMPGKSGIRLHRELKAHPALAKVPVIVVTGMFEDLAPLFAKGQPGSDIDGYLQKPFDPDDLLRTVRETLKRVGTE